MARPRLSDDNLSEDELRMREWRRAYDARRRREGAYFVNDEAVREYIERANSNDAIALWPHKGPGLW